MLIVIEFFVKNQSELDSPELDSPLSSSSELEEEPEEYNESPPGSDTLSYKLAQSCHWSVQKKCGTCFLCSIVCLLPVLPTPSILKAKTEDRGNNVAAFCAGHGWTGVPKNVRMGRCDMKSAAQEISDTRGMTKEPCCRCTEGAQEKNWPKRKKVPRTLVLPCFGVRGEGGRGKDAEIKAMPWDWGSGLRGPHQHPTQLQHMVANHKRMGGTCRSGTETGSHWI